MRLEAHRGQPLSALAPPAVQPAPNAVAGLPAARQVMPATTPKERHPTETHRARSLVERRLRATSVLTRRPHENRTVVYLLDRWSAVDVRGLCHRPRYPGKERRASH